MTEEEKKAKIVKLIKEASDVAEKSPRRSRKKPDPPASIIIKTGNGDGNGIGNTIIKTERVTHRTVATPKPGDEHITEAQVRKLHDLKDDILKLEAAGKKNPATPQRVWAALNKAMGVGAMRMIPAAKYRAAEKYLQTWIGRLMNGKAVQKKAASTVESKRIAYIQVNIKKLDIEERVRDYMEKHYQVRSLKDLPDPASLERVYRYVAGIKKEKSAS